MRTAGSYQRALDKLIAWVVSMAKKGFAKAIVQKDLKDARSDAQKNTDLNAAVAEATKHLENEELDPSDVNKQLGGIQKKYKLKIVFFYDYGFRHFWNNRRPISTPADLKGLKMRVQQGRVFADTVNGLGASAVPMPWG